MAVDPAPLVLVDYEFTFQSGQREYVQLEEGRDAEDLTDPTCIHLQKRHADGAIETITVQRAALSMLRIARRTVPPESQVQDAGQTRIEGVAPPA